MLYLKVTQCYRSSIFLKKRIQGIQLWASEISAPTPKAFFYGKFSSLK